MMLKSRVQKIERALGDHSPGMIFVCSEKEAEEQLAEIGELWPLAEPAVVIVARIKKPVSAGMSDTGVVDKEMVDVPTVGTKCWM